MISGAKGYGASHRRCGYVHVLIAIGVAMLAATSKHTSVRVCELRTGERPRMPGPDRLDWLRRRRGFAAGLAVGLVVALVAIWLLISGRPSVEHRQAAAGSPGSLGASDVPSPDTGTSSGSPQPDASSLVSAVATPSIPQHGAIGLGGWKLTLPVDGSGNLSGTAKQLSMAAVTAPWLVRNPDGSLTFWAPATGAKTANSEHSRTELVSTDDWSFGTGVHTLSAVLSVDQVPSSNPDGCVGRFQGGSATKSSPFVMLRWRGGHTR